MTAITHTRTETAIRVERTGITTRVRVTSEARGGPDRPTIRPVLLASDQAGASVSLVPEGALLLGGDAVSIKVEVGEGVALHLVEPAGTVAYDMRGSTAGWDVDVEVGAGATLIWDGEPFVAAAGSDTTWAGRITLADGARLLWRETLVLGRHGETPGRLRHTLDVRRADGTPILIDALDLAPANARLLLGGCRVIGSSLLIGIDDPDARGVRFDLEGGGVLVRALAEQMHQL